jgi:amino acid permease
MLLMGPSPPTPDPDAIGEAIGRHVGRVIGLVLGFLFAAVFVVLWVYIAAAAFTAGTLLADTWDWLTGLGPLETIVVWLAVLPIAVFVWAWQADLGPVVMGLVLLGMVAWTAVAAWAPLKRVVRRVTRRTA